ncbi:MAG: ABC transporter ATP-binding protein [Elusimicrobia bacterium]|nr:ABC transporter ATP-binding protein [Elusimicrobiota bacterium]
MALESLELRGITKEFCGVRANDGIDFSVRAGEVAALLGENGAGKTTLVNILYGLYQPDAGRLFVNGRLAAVSTPRDAMRLGIGMVHQHFMLVPKHTVAENIALGLGGVPFLRPEAEVARRVDEFCGRYGLRVDLQARVWQLSAGQRQRVEILKALVRGAQALILDEPTSVLTDSEAAELFVVLKKMAAEGRMIVYITHKLEEVMELCTSVTVLRRGKVAASLVAAQTTQEDLAALMLREAPAEAPPAPAPRAPGPEVLAVSGLRVPGDMGGDAVRGVDFSIRRGEVFGVAGISGNGQRELAEALTGLRPASAGSISLGGRPARDLSPAELRARGVRHIPEERLCVGIVAGLTVAENLALTGYRRPEFGRGGSFDPGAARARAASRIREYDIRPPSPDAAAESMSGGNIQKLILARESEGEPALIVAVHPTYGLDLGACELVRRKLLEKKAQGSAVLLIGEDLDEILLLADRVAVMFEGRFMAVLDNRGLERRELMLMMGGVARA